MQYQNIITICLSYCIFSVMSGQEGCIASCNIFHTSEVNSKTQKYPFKLPKLHYKYKDLMPILMPHTVQIHYEDYHKSHIKNLNKALRNHKQHHNRTISNLLTNKNILPKDIAQTVKVDGAAHASHTLYWHSIKEAEVTNTPTKDSRIAKQIAQDFTSFKLFKNKFSKVAQRLHGSGWVWLVINQQNKLDIMKTKNYHNPLTKQCMPILVLDMWEHAHLPCPKYDYIKKWWQIVDWDYVNRLYEALIDRGADPGTWSDVFDDIN